MLRQKKSKKVKISRKNSNQVENGYCCFTFVNVLNIGSVKDQEESEDKTLCVYYFTVTAEQEEIQDQQP